MALSADTLLGPYRIRRLIGAGGMGEVYEATDVRLDRIVAVKVLPPRVASDVERRKRFEREARAISRLNHAHIATLFDVGDQGGTHYLVMELVEGETLTEVVARGRLPLREALDYATQIADALATAHAAGIVHRDLKPGNIMITRAGVKLLDFGLAKLTADDPASEDDSAATTTRSGPLTATGTILGTVQDMAPEQLEGEETDALTDIFSFGAIVYEMLSGRKAFEGKSTASLTAAILTADPPPLAALGGAPPELEHLVRRCLAKNRNDRWQTVHDVRTQLEWIRGSLSGSGRQSDRVNLGARRGLWIVAVAILLAAIAVAGLYRARPTASGPFMLLTVRFEDQVRYSVGEDFVRSASISPDGTRIVFTGADQETGTPRLYIRPVDSEEVMPVQGSEYGTEPFWSPTSDAVGFYANGKVWVARLPAGRPQEIADATSTGGASWNRKGQILISLKNPGPLMLVPEGGGAPEPATTLDAPQEIDHDWPQFLDDDAHFLYMSRGAITAENKVYAGALGSRTRTLVLEGVSAFAYASPGHVLFLKNNDLMAQPLDEDGALTGVATKLADNAVSPFSASRTRALTYRTVPPKPNPLVWLRRDGTVIGNAIPPGFYTDPQLSPDGTRIALATRPSPKDTWDVAIVDCLRRVEKADAGSRPRSRACVVTGWASIVFVSLRPSAPGLYRKNANGVGAEELLLRSPGVSWPYQWSGGSVLLRGSARSERHRDVDPPGFKDPTILIKPPFNDVDGAVSPDGHWFAYTSNESGRWELYLTTFPVSSTKLQSRRRAAAIRSGVPTAESSTTRNQPAPSSCRCR